MVSYYGDMQTLSPTEEQTGRPRSFGAKQDANYYYDYSPRGAVTRTPKSSTEQYYWFLTRVVLYGEKGQNTNYGTASGGAARLSVDTKPPTRQTPETNYEKERGIGATNIYAIADSELFGRNRGQIDIDGNYGLIIPALKKYVDRKIEAKRLKNLADLVAEENRIIMETALAKKKLMKNGGMIILRVI